MSLFLIQPVHTINRNYQKISLVLTFPSEEINILQLVLHFSEYTGLFKMSVGVLTTCHTQYTWDRSICIFLFNRTTLQVFVTYLTGKPDPLCNPIERNHMELHLENEVARQVASDHHQSHARSIATVNAGLKILWRVGGNGAGLMELMDATRLATSFSRCNPIWFLSMGLRQASGLL